MLGKYLDYRILCVDCLTYASNISTLAEAIKNLNFKFFKTNIFDCKAIYEIFETEKPDDWYLNNKEWRETIISGEYQNY